MNLNVVGGGLTGLVAATEAAELGWRVTVHEARSTLGGRAATLDAPYRANRGPHALYTDGPLWAWLSKRNLTPTVMAPSGQTLFHFLGRLEPRPAALFQALAALPDLAPVEESYRCWLRRHIEDEQLVEAVVGLGFVVTLDHDPGRLSAAFVHERLRRGGQHVRYVEGGWARMIGQLARHAIELGVDIQTGIRVETLGDGPTVVATQLAAARALTADRSLTWPGTRTALVDLGLGPGACLDWFNIFDVDQRIYAARYSAIDPSLAPPGHHLIQVGAALSRDEPFEAAIKRVYRLLDISTAGWSDHVEWKRMYELSDQTGAIDLPGTSWHDRPAAVRSPTLVVASDQSAAPGLFSEVAHHAAREGILALTELSATSIR